MRLLGGTGSHVGNVREANQDRVFYAGELAALADGMGGHQGGERAAELAIGQFRRVNGGVSEVDLVDLVLAANRAVYGHASENGLPGMGTTLVAMTLHDDESMTVVNVGDSRAYWIRGDFMTQISEDHSFVEDLVRQGRLTPDEAAIHPQRNILTRAVGIGIEVEVDRFPIEEPEVGDRFVLCSDGLFNELPEDKILEIVLDAPEPRAAAEILIEATLETPCRDNVTVAVIEVVADDDGRLAEAATGDQAEDGVITSEYLDDANAITAQVPVVSGAVLRSVDDGQRSGDGPAPEGRSGRSRSAGNLAMAEADPTQERFIDDLQADVETSELPVVETEQVEARRGSRLVLLLGALLVVAGLAAGGYFGARSYARSGFFVAEDPATGTLAVFQGREDGLFGLFDPVVVSPSAHGPEVLAMVDLEEEAAARFDQRADAEALLATIDERLAEAEAEAEAAEAAAADASTPSTGTADGSGDEGAAGSGSQRSGDGSTGGADESGSTEGG